MPRNDPHLSVRSFEPRDCADAAALTNRFIRDTAVHFGDREQTDAEWRNMLNANRAGPDHPWLVAEFDAPAAPRFVGYAKASTWRARAAYARTAEVAVYVQPEAQRRGVARALYAALFDQLRKRGYHTAAASVTLPNDPSVALHLALGFRHVGTFRDVGYKFDAYRDVAFYQRMLND